MKKKKEKPEEEKEKTAVEKEKPEDEKENTENLISRKLALNKFFIFSSATAMILLGSGGHAAEASPYPAPPYLPPDHGD